MIIFPTHYFISLFVFFQDRDSGPTQNTTRCSTIQALSKKSPHHPPRAGTVEPSADLTSNAHENPGATGVTSQAHENAGGTGVSKKGPNVTDGGGGSTIMAGTLDVSGSKKKAKKQVRMF